MWLSVLKLPGGDKVHSDGECGTLFLHSSEVVESSFVLF